MGIRSSVATITLLSVLSFAYFTEGCGNNGGADSQCSSEDPAICNLFSAIKSRAEAHDVDGFISLVAPGYLHNCKDASQFRTKLSEVLPTVQTLAFNITSIAINESQATVSAVMTITTNKNGGAIITWTEPDTTGNSLGFGYLIKSNGQWLIFGNQWRAKPVVQVAYAPDNPSVSQYFFRFYVTSSCAVLKGAEVIGPNISTAILKEDTASGGLSGLVSLFNIPTVGDQYTFSITYNDNSQDILYDSVKAIVSVAPIITVTFEQGATQINWTDVSNQVPNAASYLVEVTLQNGTLIWSSPYSLDRMSTTFNEDGTATQLLQSKQPYYFIVMLFDIYENYTYRYQLLTMP